MSREVPDLMRNLADSLKAARAKHREKTSSLDAVAAACCECSWHSNERNALGAAAQHHDRTGHTVTVEQLTTVTYGDAAKDDGSPLPNSELGSGR